jgi:hypothetical protein
MIPKRSAMETVKRKLHTEDEVSSCINRLPARAQMRATKLVRLYKHVQDSLLKQSVTSNRSWRDLSMPDAFLRQNGDIKSQRRLVRIARNIRGLDKNIGPKIIDLLRSRSQENMLSCAIETPKPLSIG